MSDKVITFPSDEIDPSKKGKDYCKKTAEAMFSEWMSNTPKTMFAHAAARYNEIKSYALGNQSTIKYMKMLREDEAADSSYLIIDKRVRSVGSKYRKIALGKLQKSDYNISFCPIDPIAIDEMDKFYADLKAKIMLREKLMQMQPELANAPALAKKAGEPEDTEELQMQMDYGSKINLAIEAENGVAVVFQDRKNNINEHRKKVFADLFDYNVSGIKTWIDENGRVRFRKPDMRNVVVNFCRENDFSDLTYAGEVIEVELSELAKHFSEEEMEVITQLDPNQQNNYAASNMMQYTDKNKRRVFDCEWKSYDSVVKRQYVNPEGNIVFKDAAYKHKDSDEMVEIEGEMKPKYNSKTVENVYRCKWVIGSPYVYDFGKAKDQPRSPMPEKAAETELSYSFYAADMHEMETLSMMEQMIPMIDEYQMMVYRVQNLNNRIMPFGWAIDLDALEDVALGGAGDTMKPSEVLEMFWQSQVLVYRKKDLGGNNVNYKPIEVIETSYANEMTSLYNHMAALIAQIRDVSGLNELTDGSSAGKDRMPNQLIAANTESANNALFGIIDAEKCLLEKLALACFRKLQIAVKRGDYGGYINAIGGNSQKAIKVSPELADRDGAIVCEDKPSDDKKAMLMNMLAEDIKNGLLDTSDALIIMDTYSTQKAFQLLSYKVKKNKQKAQDNAMQAQQQNGQTQMQSAQAAEEEKRKTLVLKHQLEMEKEQEITRRQIAIAELAAKNNIDAKTIAANAQLISDTLDHVQQTQQAESQGQAQGQPSIPDSMGAQMPQGDEPDPQQGQPQQPDPNQQQPQ